VAIRNAITRTQLDIAGADTLPTAVGTDVALLIDSAGTLASQAFGPAGDGSDQDGDLQHGRGK